MGFKLSVAGGLGPDLLPFFEGLDISVFVIGRAIHDAPDPLAAAREIRAVIGRYWGAAAEPRLATTAMA
jgi:3-keto-L-gulonate-6-phosphate decarboxylase